MAMSQERMDRINALAKKAKSPSGLTPAEKQEQQTLRKAYLADFRENFRSQVEMLQVFDKEGREVTPEKVREIQRQKGLRDD